MDAVFESLCGSNPDSCDQVGVWVAAISTLLVLSYLVGDTPLFRLAQSLLVGTAIGYGSAVILRTVIWDQLLAPLASDAPSLFRDTAPLLIPLLLGILLLAKLVPAWSSVGNPSLGYLFGVGSALALGGAIRGALVPQVAATVVSLDPRADIGQLANNAITVIGVLGALLFFRFTRPTGPRPLRAASAFATAWGRLGRAFIMVAFGAIIANVLTARVSTLVGQLYFLFHNWLGVVR